ncbi:inorganic diphosphatase [Candidatus Saccharibacteria bacterium SW_7_54_9]|nr:MAG: inorganic diphosphatase [Candidatus Saccharibacteria bacterium SW_7_54_9]
MSLEDVTAGDSAPDEVNVVIEIPQGCGNKYEYDKDMGMLKLDRVQPTTMKQPYDYGFIPDTLSDDGDPLDALIVIEEPLYPNVVVPCRTVGVLKMIDDGDYDEKLICVAADDKQYDHVRSLEDLGEHFQKKIAHYFQHYKDLQNKEVEISGWGDVDEAHEITRTAISNHQSYTRHK